MEIVGHGFIAGHLRRIAAPRRDVVVLAAGVTRVREASPAEFEREAALVREHAARCRARGRTLVFFSTAAAALYGHPGCSGAEDCPHVPDSPYGRHKLAMEELVREHAGRWLVLRLSHLVGPGQPAHQLVPTLTRGVLSGHVLVHRGARRDLLDVEDFLRVLAALLAQDVRQEVVNVASGTSTPVEELITHLAALLGRDPVREYVDLSSAHEVSIAKLRGLLPGEHLARAPGAYHREVLDRWAPCYALETTNPSM